MVSQTVDYKIVEKEHRGFVIPFYEFKCPHCNYTFFFEKSLIESCSAFFCNHCKNRIDKERLAKK